MIQLSARDLKELDISNNEIKIVSVSDAQKWKYFLQSFGQCCVLKKIDFSGNSLGTWGVELLARVYIRSELDFVEVVESEEEDEDVPEDLMREHSTEHDDEAGSAGQGTKAARRGWSLHTYDYKKKLTYTVQAPLRFLDPSTTLTSTQNSDTTLAPVAYAQFHISSFKKST